MRCLRKVDGKWTKEDPPDLNKWLIIHDGEEAVAADDAEQIYYCSLPSMVESYREAWEKERRIGDKRTAAMFYDLALKLWQQSQADKQPGLL